MNNLKRISVIIIPVVLLLVALNIKSLDLSRNILFNYNENDFRHTQFIVNKNGYQSISGYYTMNKYDNKKENIDEDLETVSKENNYSIPRINLLKSLQNLTSTDITPKTKTPDLSMKFIIQKDKIIDKNSWNYYEGCINIYLKDNIISVDYFRNESKNKDIIKKPIYYKINKDTKSDINELTKQIKDEQRYKESQFNIQ